MDEQYAKFYNLIDAQQQKNNAWSAEQAQKAMDWQAEMSNSAHQREVADLKAAGLNPVLSAGGSGATTGSGMAASAGNENVTALFGLAKMALESNIAQAKAQSATAKTAARTPMGRFEKLAIKDQMFKNKSKSNDDPGLYGTLGDAGRDMLSGYIAKHSGMTRKKARAVVDYVFDHEPKNEGLNYLLEQAGVLQSGKSAAQLRKEFWSPVWNKFKKYLKRVGASFGSQ